MAMAIYFFNGKDITTNMIIQIRGVINVLQRGDIGGFGDIWIPMLENHL